MSQISLLVCSSLVILSVTSSVWGQQPSTVPILLPSAAGIPGPPNIIRIRQPTIVERSVERPRPTFRPVISNHLLEEEAHHDYPADPYNFGYDVRDDFGNHQYRKEEADGHGTVRGTYGYTDANGLFRYVDYVADANGFKASIRSNEPGIGNGQAANIILSAEEPPRHILDLPSAPRPTSAALRIRARPSENTPVAFIPIERNPVLSASSEHRSERLRYNFPLPSVGTVESASAPEAIHVSTPSPAPLTSSSPPRVTRSNDFNRISSHNNNQNLNHHNHNQVS